MSKYVLSMILFGGLTLGGLLGGGMISGCGEDAAPGGGSPLPSEGEGQGEGEGEDAPVEGEGEGSPNEGEGETGEGEGEGPLSPGADGEPCGQPSGGGNTCQDGLSCLACEEANLNDCDGSVCTCPQWFGGAWWFEADNLDTHGYEYDLTAGELDRQFWTEQEVEFDQRGCKIIGPDQYTLFLGSGAEGKVNPIPRGFFYEIAWLEADGITGHPLTSTGILSPDREKITGSCTGEYRDRSTDPTTFFPITCDFTLTRR